MSEERPKPAPVVDQLSAPLWNGARAHKLVIQRCSDCNYYNHPPRPFCDGCLSQRLEFQAVSGRGSIYSFTVMHQRDVAGFEHEAPFINIVVELAEQPMLLIVSNLPISERERIRVGAPVEVCFENRGADLVIPQFRVI
ncbi:MAG TPA: OB-fold domain-containing protein [Candidatus Binataceae bacterium]|nr:OB-fold domain-containing protein [Candidatus Binataceae bacterium]